MNDAILGRLGLSSLSLWRAFENPTLSEVIGAGAAMVVVLGALGVVVLLTWFRFWGPLWRDWLTSVDHKKIGIMYCALALIMLARGVIARAY